MNNETTMEQCCKREGSVAQPERIRSGRAYSPSVDIVEAENELLLFADVPGVRAEDVEISYEQGLLSLHARVQPRHAHDEHPYMLREYGIGDYYRSFQIGDGIDAQKIEAELKDGVLTLHLPKAEAVKPRRILVKA